LVLFDFFFEDGLPQILEVVAVPAEAVFPAVRNSSEVVPQRPEVRRVKVDGVHPTVGVSHLKRHRKLPDDLFHLLPRGLLDAVFSFVAQIVDDY
jgi:hypothetical protein